MHGLRGLSGKETLRQLECTDALELRQEELELWDIKSLSQKQTVAGQKQLLGTRITFALVF